MNNENPKIINQLKLLISNKKLIIFLLLAVVVVEVLGAVWFVTRPKTTQTTITPSSSPTKIAVMNKPTVIALNTPVNEVKLNQLFTVTVNVSSSKATDGLDLIMQYDPKILKVSSTKQPMKWGALYTDYLVNEVNEKIGRISLSGISSDPQGVVASGEFGNITFQAIATGKTSITIDHTSGRTTDSNVTETKTSKDLLDRVENLEINIQP